MEKYLRVAGEDDISVRDAYLASNIKTMINDAKVKQGKYRVFV